MKKSRTHSTKSRILKYCLTAAGVFVLLLAFLAVWIYFAVFFGPDPMELNEYHPFRSFDSRKRYLAFEAEMEKKWPLNSDKRFVATSFGKTFMRVSGPVDASPLVLLPGGGCNSLIWEANIEAFSENFRTYALDNIYDFGQSIYVREMRTGKDFADWLDELFDTLALGESIDIMGYSYGAWVTSQYALYHPERVSHAVLIAPTFTILPLPGKYIRRMILTLIPLRYFKSDIMYWIWSDLAASGEHGIQRVEDRINYYQLALQSFKFKQPVNPTVLSDTEIKGLTMPVLFVVGENETVYNAADAIQRLKNVNPKIHTEYISNTGHELLFTHTERVNKTVIRFLEN